MPTARYRTPIKCHGEALWSLMLKKIHNPQDMVPGVRSSRILSTYGPNSVLREMVIFDGDTEKTVREHISADPATKTVVYKLVDDPHYSGYVLNIIFDDTEQVELEYCLNWAEKNGQARHDAPDFAAQIKGAVLKTKAYIEESST